MATLSIKNLAKHYGETRVLTGIDLSVDGTKVATLRGERIVDEFQEIVLNYVKKNYSKEYV